MGSIIILTEKIIFVPFPVRFQQPLSEFHSPSLLPPIPLLFPFFAGNYQLYQGLLYQLVDRETGFRIRVLHPFPINLGRGYFTVMYTLLLFHTRPAKSNSSWSVIFSSHRHVSAFVLPAHVVQAHRVFQHHTGSAGNQWRRRLGSYGTSTSGGLLPFGVK